MQGANARSRDGGIQDAVAAPGRRWIILIGFIAGLIARFVMPGPHSPKGFLLTTALGIVGALLATLIGGATGLYRAGEGTGLIGATVGAVIILFIWNRLVAKEVIRDRGLPP